MSRPGSSVTASSWRSATWAGLRRESVVLAPDRPHRLRAVVGAVPRQALCDSCQDTAHVVVLCLLSRVLSQVHQKGDFGNEVDGVKDDVVELLNGDDGRPKRGALCGSHKTVVHKCVSTCGFIA